MRKYLIGTAAVLLPALLLYPRGQGFYLDWHNHVWMVGYFGEYFRQHLAMPEVLNTPEAAGLPQPLFYGYLFYPLLGLFSMRLHPEVVVRAAALLLFAAQYVSVRKTLRRLGAAEGLAASAACLMIWAVYGLTNLYNRSALTEFFAAGLVTCAACTWFDLLLARRPRDVWGRALRFGLLFTLAAGTHPITALYSLPLLAVLAVGLLPRPDGPGRLARLAALGVAGLLAAASLAPWVWSVRQFRHDINMADSTKRLADMTHCIDHWTARLSPVPYDSRPMHDSPADVSTPFLEAPINLALLVLSAGVVVATLRRVRGGRRLGGAVFVAVPALFTLAALDLSLRPGDFGHLPRIFLTVQFPYRLVTYVNLGFLLVLLFVLYWARERPGVRPALAGAASPVLLCFVLTLAGTVVVMKLIHAHAATIPEQHWVRYWAKYGRTYTHDVGRPHWLKNDGDRQSLAHLPLSYSAYADYTTPHSLPPVPADEEPSVRSAPLPVGWQGGGFGACRRAVVRLDAPGHVATQVAAFPWNRILVDGEEVPPERMRAWKPDRLAPWNSACQIVVPVPAGTHALGYRFVPGRTWLWLHRGAWLVLLGWLGVVAGWPLARLLGSAGRKPSPAEVGLTPGVRLGYKRGRCGDEALSRPRECSP